MLDAAEKLIALMFLLVDREAVFDDYPAEFIGDMRKRETAFGDGNALKIDRQCRRIPREKND